MASFGDFLGRLFTSPSADPNVAQRQDVADQAAAAALAAQEQARKRAELAAIPPIDKESTRLASESQLRKLLRASGFNFSGSPLGAPPVGFSSLMGQ